VALKDAIAFNKVITLRSLNSLYVYRVVSGTSGLSRDLENIPLFSEVQRTGTG